MPLDKTKTPRCVNHPETIMMKSESRSAITNIEKIKNNYKFIPDKGIPVRTYVCPTCGYVELYMEK